MPPPGLLLLLLLSSSSSSEGPSSSPSPPAWCPFQEEAPSSSSSSLCFRLPARGFECRPRSCTPHRSRGGPLGLRANVLRNGSVLLQWDGAAPPPPPSARRGGGGGFRLSCWRQQGLPCGAVLLGAACRDYFLPEASLHGGLRYRFCLGAREEEGGGGGEDGAPPGGECVEFAAEAPPAGPRGLALAMAAVGGAICLMLVLICLLVAYLTEKAPPAGGAQA